MNKKNIGLIGNAMASMLTLGETLSAAGAQSWEITKGDSAPNIAWPPFDIDKLTRKHRRWRSDNNGAFGKSAIKRK